MMITFNFQIVWYDCRNLLFARKRRERARDMFLTLCAGWCICCHQSPNAGGVEAPESCASAERVKVKSVGEWWRTRALLKTDERSGKKRSHFSSAFGEDGREREGKKSQISSYRLSMWKEYLMVGNITSIFPSFFRMEKIKKHNKQRHQNWGK